MKTRPIMFLIVMVAMLLAACEAAPSASGKISFMVFGDPAELAAYQKLVDAFTKSHSAIQVELIHIPGQSDYRKRVAADLVAGTPADVVLFNYRLYAPIASSGALEPLSTYLKNSTLVKEADFYPQALRLAAEGYAVWCDLTELLGGEDFWKDIQNVIESRTAKFLFVTSEKSTVKDGVLQELTVAKRVAKANKLTDFVIPLHIDQCQTNIEISRINYIPFNENWATGLAQLLKKLEKENTPKNASFGPGAVSEWWKDHFSSEAGVFQEKETLFSNWFSLSSLPEKIFVHIFQPGYSRSLMIGNSGNLPPTREHANSIITFAPTNDFPNSSSIFWKSSSYSVNDLLDGKHTQTLVDAKTFSTILVDLLRQAWDSRLAESGLDLYEIASGTLPTTTSGTGMRTARNRRIRYGNARKHASRR